MATNKVNYPAIGGIAQAMKYQIRTGSSWDELSPAAKESLDQITTLIARMVSGESLHWDEIINYAQAARPPGTDDPPVVDIERGMRTLVEKVARTGNA
jgi:hypothetical protein